MSKIPNGWNEVNVETYCDLKQMDESKPNFFTRQIEILSILTGTFSDDAEWSDMDIEELTNKTAELTWLRNEPNVNYKREINAYKSIDVNNLTFGEFVDLEFYFTNDLFENLPKILATIYRKHKTDDFGNVVMEELGSYDLNQRAVYFNQISIEWVYGLIYEFMSFKTNIYESYKALFQPPITQEEMDEYEVLDDYPVTAEELEAERMEKMAERWSWENITYRLADGDITKYDAIMKMPVIFIFNQLSFLKEMRK